MSKAVTFKWHTSGVACRLALIYLLSVFLSTCFAQATAEQGFRKRCMDIMSTTGNTDPSRIDKTVDSLLSVNQQQAGIHDSIALNLLIWHFNDQSKRQGEGENERLLYRYRVLAEKMRKADPADLARFYGLFLHNFFSKYQRDSIALYLRMIDAQLALITKPSIVRAQWLYEKGRFAFNEGDYAAALTFSQRALEYIVRYFPDQIRLKYLVLNTIGIGYRRTGQTDEAISHYEDLLATSRPEADKAKMTGAILNNLGLAYKDCGDWTKAIRCLSDAIHYYAVNLSPTYEDIGSGYDNIAICYQLEGRLDSALLYSRKSLDFIKHNLGPRHPDLLLPMCSMMRTYLDEKNLKQALALNLEAIALLKDLGWHEDNPEGDYYLADGFDVFAYGREIYRDLYDLTQDSAYLQKAITDGGYFMAMTDYAYDNLKNDLSRELFQLKHGRVFAECINDLYTLNQIHPSTSLIDRAFSYSEKFKALELLYAAQKDKAGQVSRYNALNKEFQALSDSIRYYEHQMDESLSHPISADVQSRLNRARESLYLWKENVKQAHPDYYQLIYHPEPISIEELQRALTGSDQCLLSYHITNNSVYLIIITDHDARFIRTDFQMDLQELIADFRHSISGYFTDSTRSETQYALFADQFAQSSVSLYQLLIAPAAPYLKNRVVIIVDQALGYIPFDILAGEAPASTYRFAEYPYFLFDHPVSYSYSARLWMEARQQAQPNLQSGLLAMAPVFDEANSSIRHVAKLRGGMGPLFFNTREVDEINQVMRGKILTGKRATKRNFIRYAPGYALLHLATHSKANDNEGDFSYLAFTGVPEEDNKLYAGEIYDLKLHAELVTLSACETGLGELKSGEGIISLARAFTMAGARSIVSSLWSVNDRSTPDIMSSFYQYLKAGLPKDVAMQKAKKDFIQSRGHADAHPFYWGSFICVGDMRPVGLAIPGISYVTWGILSAAGLILFIFLIKNLNRLGTPRI